MNATERFDELVSKAQAAEPTLGALVSYSQEEDHFRLDFEHGTVKYGLDYATKVD